MTPSVKETIAEVFPNHSEEEILSKLRQLGDGIAHAASAISYCYAIRRSAGDLEELDHLVDQAIGNPSAFAEEQFRWSNWLSNLSSYKDDPEMSGMVQAIRDSALAAAKCRFKHFTSHRVLCLYPHHKEFGSPISLYVFPILNGGVFITRSPDAAGYCKFASDIADDLEGELLPADIAGKALARHIRNVFGEHNNACSV